MRKLTKEEFINREPDLLNGEYEFVGEYKGANIKTLFKHNICDYEWEIAPSHFHQGTRCPKCSGNIVLIKEEFCQREEDIVSGEYKMIGMYVNSYTKTLFKHNVCGYEWEITPNGFHTGHRCPRCSGHMKLNKESFCKREDDIQSGEYEFIGRFEGIVIKTLFKHNSCGYRWMVAPSDFYKGTRCPRCAGNAKLTKNIFCSRERDIQSGEYEMLGDYVNTMTKALFKHVTCGYEWKTTPSHFHKGHRCPRCAKRERFTKESFCEREPDIISGQYEMLGDYVNIYTKTLFKHNVCGYEWEITPNGFHTGHRCPRCFIRTITFSKRDFCEREKDIVSGEYELIGEYINNNTKTIFKHAFCGYEWEVRPGNFHQGTRCPKCNQSRGERVINKLLESLDIEFESQKRFDSCRYKNTLPFDFYVNNSFLIEYDGEQHFKPVDFTGKGNEWADKSFKLGQLRDNIKTQWAKNNSIPLVRIPYTEFDNIEQIIKDSIEKYSIQKAG